MGNSHGVPPLWMLHREIPMGNRRESKNITPSAGEGLGWGTLNISHAFKTPKGSADTNRENLRKGKHQSSQCGAGAFFRIL